MKLQDDEIETVLKEGVPPGRFSTVGGDQRAGSDCCAHRVPYSVFSAIYESGYKHGKEEGRTVETQVSKITPRHFGFIGDGGPGDTAAMNEYQKYMNGVEAMKDDKPATMVIDGALYYNESCREKIHQLGKKEGREELQDEIKKLLGMEI